LKYKNCEFREIYTVERNHPIGDVLSTEGLAWEFGTDRKPDVFILFILAHGDKDGEIQTDIKGYSFTTFEIWEALKSNDLLKEAVKIFFFGVSLT
jgi:hypothetical protein